MDTTLLKSISDDLAGFLSEVTEGDLGQPLAAGAGTIGDLYLRVIDQNLHVARLLASTRPDGPGPADATVSPAALSTPADGHGAGYDLAYRRTSAQVLGALEARVATDLVEPGPSTVAATVGELSATITAVTQGDAVLLAASLGLPYEPVSLVRADVGRQTA